MFVRLVVVLLRISYYLVHKLWIVSFENLDDFLFHEYELLLVNDRNLNNKMKMLVMYNIFLSSSLEK